MTTRPSDPIHNVPASPKAARRGSRAAVEAVWRIEAARLIASLARLTGDLSDAEDLAQDALVAALEQWPAHGIPPNPGGWLMTTAKNRLIDQIRRDKTMQRKLPHLHHERERQDQATDAARDESLDDQIGDELLSLIFTACHPALSIESRVALTLRCLGGLSTDQVARALLIGEPTAAQRIVRAKKTLRDKSIAFELPSPEQIRERLPGVLQVLYLIFNEGYAASSGPQWIRPSLCEEALRLARVLAGVLPDVAEVQGFLALLELQTARIPARTTGDGDAVLILDQDRRLWDRLLTGRGLEGVHRAERLAAAGSPVGPYMLQAGIAACHARARRPQDTDWKTILGLYDVLRSLWPNPVVELNRTVAVAMVNGPQAALAELDKLSGDPRLRAYCYLPAVRAHVLEQAGQHDAARDSWLLAAKLTRNERERQLYEQHAQERSRPCKVIKAGTRKDANVKGADYGASISLILDESAPGQGLRLHRHPYDEAWVVQEGNLTFQCGEERWALGAGDIVIVPPGVAHKFTNDGPSRSKLVCIHASPTFIGEWLE